MTQEAAAEAMGLSKSGYIKIEDRDRRLSVDRVLRAAEIFNVAPRDVLPDAAAPEGWRVAVRGLVGAGNTIDTSSEQLEHDPLFEVTVPFPVPEDSLAFQIRGESMWPKYDPGDVIVCSRFAEEPSGALGFIMAVETADGGRFLKRVLKGSRPGLYSLESPNAATMPDVQVVKFASVIAVIPAIQVQQVGREARRSVAKQIREKKPLRA